MVKSSRRLAVPIILIRPRLAAAASAQQPRVVVAALAQHVLAGEPEVAVGAGVLRATRAAARRASASSHHCSTNASTWSSPASWVTTSETT